MFAKVKRVEHPFDTHYIFHCPACDETHSFITWRKDGGRPIWKFNGDLYLPTFSPSLLYRYPDKSVRCHLIMMDGRIKYCNDCPHDLAGQEVDMVDRPD